MTKTLLAALSFIIASSSIAQKSKSVFLELGGNGGLGSFNFDSRLNNTEKGLGYRVGFGFIPPTSSFFDSRPTIWTFPVGLNYLIGGHRHYFETGLGLTYYFLKALPLTFGGFTKMIREVESCFSQVLVTGTHQMEKHSREESLCLLQSSPKAQVFTGDLQ